MMNKSKKKVQKYVSNIIEGYGVFPIELMTMILLELAGGSYYRSDRINYKLVKQSILRCKDRYDKKYAKPQHSA